MERWIKSINATGSPRAADNDSRKIKASPGRSGVAVSRRRVCRIMRENDLVSTYGRKGLKVHPGAVNEADVC